MFCYLACFDWPPILPTLPNPDTATDTFILEVHDLSRTDAYIYSYKNSLTFCRQMDIQMEEEQSRRVSLTTLLCCLLTIHMQIFPCPITETPPRRHKGHLHIWSTHEFLIQKRECVYLNVFKTTIKQNEKASPVLTSDRNFDTSSSCVSSQPLPGVKYLQPVI